MRILRLVLLAAGTLALGAAGTLGAVGLAGASGSATPLDGTWRGGHLWRIAGTLEGGFTIYAGETYTVIGCQISAGEMIWQLSPSGGGMYAARYEWIESSSSGPKCAKSVRGPDPVKVALTSPNTLVFSECGSAYVPCGTFTRAGPAPTTTTKPTTTKPAPTTIPTPTTTAPTPPKPKPKPKPPEPDRGFLQLAVALQPAGTTSSISFKVCVKKLAGGTTLCYLLKSGRVLVAQNHGKRMEWQVGTRLQVCENEYAGWITLGCRAITIGKGANRLTLVNRRDASPPTVQAFPKSGVTKPATRGPLEFTVKDDSGRATLHAGLYEGGTVVKAKVWELAATGKRQQLDTLFMADLVGPLYFCVWAEDAAGNRSAKAPESSCAWVSLLAPIEKVSNGCGGRGWDVLVWAQNYFLNEHTFQNSNVNPLALEYDVNFKAACDLHDAGYGGYTVRDAINGGTIDFRTWSRPKVDEKFLADMLELCDRQIRPANAKVARANCKARGGNVSIGAETLYNFVSKQGWRFFDADLTKPGIQKRGERCQFRPCADE